ncbi:MAG: GGDEF domain-containing protein [Woeseiaceae bacterium]|nr:GGDEF domain-containing protein [Woeseiaceae bacterium]
MKTRVISTRKGSIYGTSIALVIFLIDLQNPLGVASATPYIALPLLGLLARSPRSVIALAVLGTTLNLAGLLLSPSGAPYYVVLTNRIMALVMIWVVAYVAIQHLSTGDKLRAVLRKAAFRDPLTGLFNRRYVFGIFTNELNRYRRYKDRFSLILIDADHFKRVNDNHGHCGGDAALKKIANACTESVRDSDIVGRFGGEEFIILLPNTSASDAADVAERIRSAVQNLELIWEGRRIRLSLSLGVAEVGAGADTFDDLLKAADNALYTAKKRGRNRTVVAGETHLEARGKHDRGPRLALANRDIVRTSEDDRPAAATLGGKVLCSRET